MEIAAGEKENIEGLGKLIGEALVLNPKRCNKMKTLLGGKEGKIFRKKAKWNSIFIQLSYSTSFALSLYKKLCQV